MGMERRKLQLVKELEAIKEEKRVLNDNLDKILDQVEYYIGQAQSPSNHTRPKDVTQILSFELDVLRKFVDINIILETLIENPLRLSLPDVFSILDNPGDQLVEVQSTATELNLLTPDVVANSFVENESFNSVRHFSDPDVQIVRETFKEISQKLGLNDPCFSSIKNFYEKPSTSSVREFPDISFRDLSNDISSQPDDTFQIPEKDLNSCTLKESNTIGDVLEPNVIKTEYQEHTSQMLDDTDKNGILVSANSSNDLCSTESSSLENLVVDNKDDIPESSDDTNFEVSSQFEESKTGSVLEKLINYMSKKDTELQPLELPDLSLRPVDLEKLEFTENIKMEETKKESKNVTLHKPAPLNDKIYKLPDLNLRPVDLEKLEITENTKIEEKKKKSKKVTLHKSPTDKKIYKLKHKGLPQEGDLCAFSYIKSPSEFYIHLVDTETTYIDDISEKISKWYEGTGPEYETKKSAFKGIQRFCSVYIDSYKLWYRAKVVDWRLEATDEDVLVHLVDYGNELKVSYKQLKKLKRELTKVPMLAIRCHFPLMYPPESTFEHRLTQWPEQTLSAMMQLSGLTSPQEKDSFFKLSYVSYEEQLKSVAVDLFNVKDSDENTTIGEILLRLDLAIQLSDEITEVDTFLQDVDILEKDENINEMITGYDARDEARICQFSRPDGTCFKGKNCKLEHMPLSKDGFTTDKEAVFREAMYNLLLPAVGMWCTILITSYVDTCNFFAQIITKPYQEKNYIMDEDFHHLLELMNSPKITKTYEPFKIAPAIGEVVIAKHWTDKWLRAIVRDFQTGIDGEPTDIHLFNVDFGDHQKIHFSKIRKIKPQFLELPFQAVLCYIHNYKMKKTCSTKEAKKFFFDNMFFHNFLANIMSSQLPLKIELRSLNTKLSIGESLEQNGFAEPKAFDTHPVDGCCLELY